MTILKDLRSLKRLHDNRNFGECLYCAALIDILIRYFSSRTIKSKCTKSIGGRSDKGRSLHKKKGG